MFSNVMQRCLIRHSVSKIGIILPYNIAENKTTCNQYFFGLLKGAFNLPFR
jgi:hypothetical protein